MSIIWLRPARHSRLFAGLALSFAFGGCSDSAGPTTVPVAAVIVSMTDATVSVGGTSQATLVLKDAHGNNLTGREASWTSSDPNVASVGSTGVVTGVALGTVTITATSEGKSGSLTLPVVRGVASVTVNLPQPGLSVGFSIQASDTLKDGDGNVLTGRAVTWSSSNTAVATVTVSGVVTAVGHGSTEITATTEGKSGSATIGVVVIKPRSLSLGNAHTCAISLDGDAYCWGSNYNGQLGNGNKGQNATAPSLVVGGLKFVAISTGLLTPYALSTDGRFHCWGGIPCDPSARVSMWDEYMGPAVPAPQRVPTSRAIESLGAISASTPVCALGVANASYCWGSNRHGELGIGTRTQETILVPDLAVAGNHSFTEIAAGAGHACAITTAGLAFCWGYATLGALGDGSSTESLEPQPVAGNHVFKAIGAGLGFSCGLTTAGEAYCWGYNKIGSLGTATGTCLGQDIDPCSAVPVAVSGGYIFESFSVGAFATCGVTAAGDIYCWGPDYGSTPTPFRSVLASDPGGVRFRTVSVGPYHACAISTTGDMYCRGLNNLGQLGNGTIGNLTRTQEPTMVVGGIKFRAP